MSLSVATYTKSGGKSQTSTKLDKDVFGEKKFSAELLKQAYLHYLDRGRQGAAKTLKRGEVRGGGRKPWRQKGTGRARHGSIRSPIWRGGGVVFGPSGEESFVGKLSKKAKRNAIKQALSIAAESDKIKVIEAFQPKDGKTREAHNLLMKLEANKRVLVVVENKTTEVGRATSNLKHVLATQANYLNVFDIMNADTIVFEKNALKLVKDWLVGGKND